MLIEARLYCSEKYWQYLDQEDFFVSPVLAENLTIIGATNEDRSSDVLIQVTSIVAPSQHHYKFKVSRPYN